MQCAVLNKSCKQRLTKQQLYGQLPPISQAKLKAASQQERVKLWEQHFKNLLGNPPKITNEPITRIISKQLDIKLGPFTKEELDSVLRKIKNRKAAGLDEIPTPRSVED